MRPQTAYLAVSLFSAKMQGTALANHVAKINGMGFTACVVSLGDTLHRFNLPLDETGEDRRHAQASALGDNWIAENGAILGALTPPWRLMRHDELLAVEGLPAVRAALEDYLERHAPLKAALDRDIETFGKRKGRLGGSDASRAYFLEELAADIAFAQIQPFTYIYPGTAPQIYQVMQQAHAPAPLQGLGSCVFVATRVSSDGRVRVPVWARTAAGRHEKGAAPEGAAPVFTARAERA